MNAQQQIVVTQHQGRVPVTVFQLNTNLDVNFYEDLQKQAQEAFEGGMRNLIIDLSQVKYMSSAGLRALHYIFTLLRTDAANESDAAMRQGLKDGTFKSPHLKLLNPTPHVQEVLKISGFDMFLEIHHDLNTAVASF